MSRLTPLDKALVWILVPLWIVCFSLSVRSQVRGRGMAGLGLSIEAGEHYPTLTGEYATIFHAVDPLAEAGLRAGDRLIRLGNADLLGVGTPLAFMAHTLDQASPELSIPLTFERNGEQRTTSLSLVSVSTFLPGLASAVALALSGVFLLLRARPTPTVRAWFYYAMCMAFARSVFPGSRVEMYVAFAMIFVMFTLFFPLLLNFWYQFPDGRAPAARWHRIWPWLLSVPFSLSFALQLTDVVSFGVGQTVFGISGAIGGLGTLAIVLGKYRRADPTVRRQMKWVLLGFYCTFVTLVAGVVAPILDPRLAWLFFASFWAAPLLPLSILISIVRFNLFDIDRILSATASYNILAVGLGAGALVVVPRVAEALSGVVGVDPGTGQIVLSLLLAGAVVPAHRRLRPQIDRVFFKERYALDQGIAALLPSLSQATDARMLTERVGEGLNRLLRPDVCVVYARIDETYTPVFVEGRAVPPAFEAASQLIGALRERRIPLALGDAGRRPDEAPLGPFDRAALETLAAEVVVPIHQDDTLVAFICLGPKRSGDVYTATDLSLLAVVTETVSRQLRLFDQEDVIREGYAMRESLRRYVPGAVADQLATGGELTSGECEVSVLFVDIRGYTSFSESRKADEIFATVNRYTETVSQIVQKHGGAVVEFNGDGMMAVFGAPRELAHKERAAVEAGVEIVGGVGEIPIDDAVGSGGSSAQLSVGVGIATGEAFVGNIKAVDRMIWSAIGNTTNLAARLQSLTRELAAALVIDHTTWERAQPAAAGFEKHPDVAIRGRRETYDLYAMAMPVPSQAATLE